jgi:hypothetical protein
MAGSQDPPPSCRGTSVLDAGARVRGTYTVAQRLSARNICPVDVHGDAKWLVDLFCADARC